MERNCLLSTAYWPPVQYFTKLIQYQKVFIEAFETYPKQSFRNRMEIYGANGKLSLQIPVVKASFKKQLIKDVEISYDIPWQKNHLKTIESAYRSSPFFEFYIDEILPFYTQRPKYLINYNDDILKLCCEMLGIDAIIEATSEFYLNAAIPDYRDCIHPKKKMQKKDEHFLPSPYLQGFEQRHGFMANLSILDVIFNCGPEALDKIKASITG